MLETRKLTKIYKPKKGVPVVALNGVTLKFPDTGMVFLLGKSGSGKSTLLNVLGGLDRYDSGEILIKGKSSKTFRQRHFDSYRNTYVGFIFQEYNILDEFSVGANIGLALQLQGQKATSEKINEILKEVDLEGYGNRKPNELSGGQKQRVAIARALVKSPKIIMADEPTGALDSVTGRQILTTLKKLSRDKLVIVVSHDQEFAETYADRIIELSDGSVIRDVERTSDGSCNSETPIFENDEISLPEEYVLTEEDKERICNYIQKMVRDGKAPKFALHGKEGKQSFQPTNHSRIQSSQDGYHLIKSKLPMKFAFKMGASGLKHKRFRLVMTILLSCVAFILFGLADTMASYSYVRTAHGSLTDPECQVTYLAFEKNYKYFYGDDDEDFDWVNSAMTKEDYELIEEKTGMVVYPVLNAGYYQLPSSGTEMDMFGGGYTDVSIPLNIDNFSSNSGYSSYYAKALGGYVEIDEDRLEELGGKLIAGELPKEGTNEICISTFVVESFKEYGYTASLYSNGGYSYGSDGMPETEKIQSGKDLLGKTLNLQNLSFTIVGIIDTGLDFSRYEALQEEQDGDAEFSDMLIRMVLETELRYVLNYSLTGLGMVAPGQLESIYEQAMSNTGSSEVSVNDCYGSFSSLEEVAAEDIVWLDGKARDQLEPNEIVMYEGMYGNFIFDEETDFNYQYNSENPDYSAILAQTFFMRCAYNNGYDWTEETYDVTIVGIIPGDCKSPADYYISQSLLDEMTPEIGEMMQMQTIGAMPKDSGDIMKIVEFSAGEFEIGDETVCFNLMNPECFELKNLDGVFKILRTVFMWIGIGFVVFASLLFSNFIGTSISYKKREIGILRAIGSRSNDVFRIFFAESFIIAMINFTISLAGTIGICAFINWLIRNQAGLLLTILNVGIRQVALLFGVCLLVAAIASFVPVRRIAAKRPIDAIRDR